jgi:hypothetical protein
MMRTDEFNHVTDEAAKALITKLRAEFSGMYKIYGARYVRALSEVCGYRETDYDTYQIGCTVRTFKSKQEAGVFMEKTINDLFALGIKK